MPFYVRDVEANLGGKGPGPLLAPASTSCMRCELEFLESRAKKALDAARAKWFEAFERYGSQLPEVMTHD